MIWAKEETMSRAEIEAIQLSRLKDTVNRVYEKVPAYRAKMEEAGVRPEHIQTLKDLQKLPFVTKQDMREQLPLWPVCGSKEGTAQNPRIQRYHGKANCGGLYGE